MKTHSTEVLGAIGLALALAGCGSGGGNAISGGGDRGGQEQQRAGEDLQGDQQGQVGPLADLVLTTLPGYPGQYFIHTAENVIAVCIANLGAGTAERFHVSVRYTTAFGTTVHETDQPLGPLGPDQLTGATLTAPPKVSAQMEFFVDSRDEVVEEDEENNLLQLER